MSISMGDIAKTSSNTIQGGIGLFTAGAQSAAGAEAAAAQGKAGQATYDAAKQTYADAAPTALELGNMHQQLTAAGTSLQRQQQMYANIDPALMQAGQQALQLMQGKNAATIQPMLDQRAVQRTQLQQQLQQQLGPGGEVSSAGQQALQNFDMQTNTYQAQLQQGALQTLSGFTEQGIRSGAQSGQQAGALFGQVGQQSQGIQQRMIGAGLAPYAADQYVGAIAQANNAAASAGAFGKSMGQLFGGTGFNSTAYGLPGGNTTGSTSATSGYGTGSQAMSDSAGYGAGEGADAVGGMDASTAASALV